MALEAAEVALEAGTEAALGVGIEAALGVALEAAVASEVAPEEEEVLLMPLEVPIKETSLPSREREKDFEIN